MKALLGRIFLVVAFPFMSLYMYQATPFWPIGFLMKNRLMAL